MSSQEYSDYIVYVDESGDANLEKINPDFPAFVLTFCIFKKKEYSTNVVPAILDLKFKYFGHDMVVLHEREINKKEKAFSKLNKDRRNEFLDELTKIIKNTEMTIIAIVVKKEEYKNTYRTPSEPYALAMQYGLERLYHFIRNEYGGELPKTYVVFEARGKTEDKNLELAFRRICDGDNYQGFNFPFDIIIANKQTNSTGLQLADLTARPIGLFVLRPEQANRTYEILKEKFRKEGKEYMGYGLKVIS